jgi:hypothetical protein
MTISSFKKSFLAVLSALFCLPLLGLAAETTQSLAGQWQVQLQKDPQQVQVDPAGKWLPVKLPGSLATNNLGDEISLQTPWMGGGIERAGFLTEPRYAPYRQPGKIKVPFWLQPCKYYKGKAWYRREIEIPAGWKGKTITLMLERCHWGSAVWIDGKPFTSTDCESLSAPHRYDLGSLVAGKHTLTICIDNNYLVRVGPDASSISDHTQSNWNGIVGKIELSAQAPLHIASQQVYPQNNGSVQVKLGLRNSGKDPAPTTIRLDLAEKKTGKKVGSVTKTMTIPAGETTAALDLNLAKPPQLWSEFTPNLYTATATIANEAAVITTFGFREIKTDGHTLLVNGVPTFLRGNLDCAAFPLTGHPAMDVAEWTRIFRVYKAYGLNHARFHSWCPPEAAFIAADQEGMYLQPEGGVWRGTCPFGQVKPVEPFLYEEGERISRAYGNHPSFVIYAHGNEPWELDQKKLNDDWVPAMKKLDPRHLVAAGSNYPLGDNNDVHIPGGGYGVRYHGAFSTQPATTRNYEKFVATKAAPCITHEPGEWCAFPNLDEIRKYTGVMKARNFEIVRDFLKNAGMLDQADDFLMASGKFQTLVYQEETEAFLRTRGLAGFQMLGLNDFPGQGTALVGVVDALWNAKPYVSAAEFKRFSGPVVPLAIMEKRTWTNDETFKVQIRIAQYSETPIAKAEPAWKLTTPDGKVFAKGKLPVIDIPVGNTTELGTIEVPLGTITAATQLTLQVEVPGYANDWHLWVYPKTAPEAAGQVVACTTADEALAALQAGKSVLFNPPPKQIAGNAVGTFQPIFWNKNWFPGQKEHTLGLLVKNRHPALADFPTDFHADWQWWDLMQNYKPMILDGLPRELAPIVQPIDDWNTCRKLAMAFEAQVGKGKLLMVSADLQKDLAKRPVARQFRQSLLAYMNSKKFQPKVTLTEEQIRQLIASKKPTGGIANITASSENEDYPAANAIDGNPETIWHTEWTGNIPNYPHEITLELTKPGKLAGVSLLPRQDGNPNGWVKDVEIQVSADGKTWTTATKASLANNHEWKQVKFPSAEAKFLRIRCLSPQSPTHPWASFAEIAPVIQP